MIKLSLSRAWDDSRDIAKRDGGLLTSVALALLVLPATVAGAINPEALTTTAMPGGRMLVLWMVVGIIGLIGRLALIRLALGPSTTVGDAIRDGLARLPSTFAALLIFVLPISVALTPVMLQVLKTPLAPPPGASLAMLVIIIAAVVLGIRLVLLALPVAVAEKAGPIAILKRSWQLTRGNWWRLAAFVLLFFIGSAILTRAVTFAIGIPAGFISGSIKPLTFGALMLSLAVALVGALAAVLFSLMLARVYAQLAGAAEDSAAVPSNGT